MIAELSHRLEHREQLFFLQVGANDGKQSDPLWALISRHPLWEGLMVEPLPHYFDQLRSLYSKRPGIQLANVAVSETAGERALYQLSPEAYEVFGDRLPNWWTGVASFDAAHVARHFEPRVHPYIVTEQVRCEPLLDILRRFDVQTINLLLIDVEGYDLHVLEQFDFARYRPQLVLYEHENLTPDSQRRSEALLVNAGYTFRRFAGDTLAVRSSPTSKRGE